MLSASWSLALCACLIRLSCNEPHTSNFVKSWQYIHTLSKLSITVLCFNSKQGVRERSNEILINCTRDEKMKCCNNEVYLAKPEEWLQTRRERTVYIVWVNLQNRRMMACNVGKGLGPDRAIREAYTSPCYMFLLNYFCIIHNQRCIEVCASLKLRCIWYSSSVMSWVLRSLEWGTHNALSWVTCNVLSSHTKSTHRYCTCWCM